MYIHVVAKMIVHSLKAYISLGEECGMCPRTHVKQQKPDLGDLLALSFAGLHVQTQRHVHTYI